MHLFGRSGAVKINAISVDGFDRPALACRDDEIIGEKVIEGVQTRLEVLRRGRIGGRIIVLIVENNLRELRGRQNVDLMNSSRAAASFRLFP